MNSWSKVVLSAMVAMGMLLALSTSSSYAAPQPREPETLTCKHSGTCCKTDCSDCCSKQCQSVTTGCGSGTRCQGS
jgi:hypothetical protein